MSTVIQISNLSKIYRLGEIGTGTISRDLERWYKMKIRGQEDPFLKIGETNVRNSKGVSDVVYALKDINFEVQRGEALGIIGKNGAGKSTLLKIISRVTSPTTGKINIKGRVASLLEVGTGFHPELTGRENIYLNGAILGMRKKEITRKLDEIIDFSGVERYIDTPVKRYSSGMYVRLAFAVAAHLESEILIVDEVLSVGDAEFQKKCLGKMGEVSKGEGRTVLFVSHNMGAVLQLCSRVVLLSNGMMKYEGMAAQTIDYYLNNTRNENCKIEYIINPEKEAQIYSIAIYSSDGRNINSFKHNQQFSIIIDYNVKLWPKASYVCIDIFSSNNRRMIWSADVESIADMLINRSAGSYRAMVSVPGNVFIPGTYYITVAIYAPGKQMQPTDVKDKEVSFTITDGGSLLSNFNINGHAETSILLNWNTKKITGVR